MPRFLIFKDVRETRKYVVAAKNYEAAFATREEAQELRDLRLGFIEASTTRCG
jgi:hypothetical protein